MNNNAKIQLQDMLDAVKEHIREYSTSLYEQEIYLKSCSAQLKIWQQEARDKVK